MTGAGRAAPQILVATDFSDEAEAALREAVDQAKHFGARLHIFHVRFAGELGVTRLLADAKALAGQGVSVIVASASGDPASEILRYAREHAIDRIVLGTHGRSGVRRAILGSVAERVQREAACPVLTVPSRALAGRTEAPCARAAREGGD
jgi:nucleotide-binding universal stress UspA family protein